MSGHSKFNNIKHRKEKSDAIRGKIFTRLGREIAVAVKANGPDPSGNSKLKDIIAKAKNENMPNDTIERAIKKASGELSAVEYAEITYEGYGPNGVAIMVKTLTDNKNRAAANVRNAFTKGDGNVGTTGCVSFMFDEKGLIMIEKDKSINEDDLMMVAPDNGAEDFVVEEEGYEIITLPDSFTEVREAIEKFGIPMISAEVTMIPQVYTKLTDPEHIKKMKKLLALLDEEDDVQAVYHNWDNEDE